MRVTPARIRRALRSEGLPTSEPLIASLVACQDARAVRARLLALRRTATGPPHPPPDSALSGLPPGSWLELVTAWERGQPNPWLDEAERLGLNVSDLLGHHESVLHLVGLTISRCLRMDLRARADIQGHALTHLASLSSEVCQAADAAVLQEAERSLLAHSNPAQLTHFCRIWPANADLAPLRTAYLAILHRLAPELGPERSVVGSVSVIAGGQKGEISKLYDWDAEAERQSAAPDAGGLRWLPLRCGVRVPVELDLRHTNARFSAFELIEREPLKPTLLTRGDTELPETDGFCPEDLDRPGAPLVFPAVDILLVTLASSVIGRSRTQTAAWLPSIPISASTRSLPLPSHDRESFLRAIMDTVAPYATMPDAPPSAILELMALHRDLSDDARCPELSTGRRLVDTLTVDDALDVWVSAWAVALFGLCLWRWNTGLQSLLGKLSSLVQENGVAGFAEVASAWLSRRLYSVPPTTRRRRPDGLLETAPADAEDSDNSKFNMFNLDLASGIDDINLMQVCLHGARHPTEMLTWGLNEWTLARRFAETLALRARLKETSAATQDRTHGSSVWVHHRLLARPTSSLDAFKRMVSKEGLVPWSLSELDEAISAARRSAMSRDAQRLELARRTSELPNHPWAAAKCWVEGRRSLAWLVEWAERSLLSGGRLT